MAPPSGWPPSAPTAVGTSCPRWVWVHDELHFVANERSPKSRNLSVDARCVFGLGSEGSTSLSRAGGRCDHNAGARNMWLLKIGRSNPQSQEANSGSAP